MRYFLKSSSRKEKTLCFVRMLFLQIAAIFKYFFLHMNSDKKDNAILAVCWNPGGIWDTEELCHPTTNEQAVWALPRESGPVKEHPKSNTQSCEVSFLF